MPPAWPQSSDSYAQLISNPKQDSEYLRRMGLEREVSSMVSALSWSTALDVGAGTGWLSKTVADEQVVYSCDLYPSAAPRCSMADVRALPYADSSFDLVVASMMLMWFSELAVACAEMARVASPEGYLVVALPHPYSYRTGCVTPDGLAVVQRPYCEEWVLEDLWINDTVGPLTYYHRPLSAYVNTLSKAGWYLQKMVEWTVDLDEHRRLFPNPKRRRTDRLPMYVFLTCART